ncbi:MAG: radical SAM protein [Phycisphaerae bacterium]|nr:radical SAM protein [Phycisphaerae bacterium]
MPLGFVYEITPRCNLNCGFCYNVWPRDIGELDAEAACGMLQRVLGSCEAEWLTFTGGEPLLYDDLDSVVAFVQERFPHIRLGLATNATLLSHERLSRLIEAGIQYIEISLFASDNASYRDITGVDVFDSVREAIAQVKLHNLPLTVANLLSRPTGPHLETTIEIAFALGADILALNRFVPTGRGKQNERTFSLSTDELDDLLTLADKKSAKLGFKIAVTLPVENCILPHERYPHLHFGRCLCGESKWAIDPLGRLRTCEQNAEILGSLLDENFASIARNLAVREFRRNNAQSHCPQCDHFEHCGGGCRFAERHTGPTA